LSGLLCPGPNEAVEGGAGRVRVLGHEHRTARKALLSLLPASASRLPYVCRHIGMSSVRASMVMMSSNVISRIIALGNHVDEPSPRLRKSIDY